MPTRDLEPINLEIPSAVATVIGAFDEIIEFRPQLAAMPDFDVKDVDLDGLIPPVGITVLGMSSDHLVLNVGDHPVSVGDELSFGVAYGALLRAMTSPFVTKTERIGPWPSRSLPYVGWRAS